VPAVMGGAALATAYSEVVANATEHGHGGWRAYTIATSIVLVAVWSANELRGRDGWGRVSAGGLLAAGFGIDMASQLARVRASDGWWGYAYAGWSVVAFLWIASLVVHVDQDQEEEAGKESAGAPAPAVVATAPVPVPDWDWLPERIPEPAPDHGTSHHGDTEGVPDLSAVRSKRELVADELRGNGMDVPKARESLAARGVTVDKREAYRVRTALLDAMEAHPSARAAD
jgi:hypothetical protein